MLLGVSTVIAVENKISKPVKAKSEKVVATPKTEQVKVTFIELGSVKCMPCKMMEPILDEVKKEYPYVKVEFHDVWTEEGRTYGEKYQIRSIPTQIFLDKNGQEYARHTGFFPKADLVKVLAEGLAKWSICSNS